MEAFIVNRGKENCCCEDPKRYEPEEMECNSHPRPGKETATILNCGTVVGSAHCLVTLELPLMAFVMEPNPWFRHQSF
jgi:hypothetical protein